MSIPQEEAVQQARSGWRRATRLRSPRVFRLILVMLCVATGILTASGTLLVTAGAHTSADVTTTLADNPPAGLVDLAETVTPTATLTPTDVVGCNCPADQYEPDNTQALARPLPVTNLSQTHTFDTSTDVDWYRFDGLTTGSSYVVWTADLVGGLILTWPCMIRTVVMSGRTMTWIRRVVWWISNTVHR